MGGLLDLVVVESRRGAGGVALARAVVAKVLADALVPEMDSEIGELGARRIVQPH
jgi:hypothetical protein